MSYDISLEINTGKEMRKVVGVGNYTYNCAGMFVEASETGESLSELHGMKCTEAEPIIAKAVENMQKDPQKYKAMEPDNGWGSYNGFLEYVETLLRECRQNPECTIGVY